MRDCFEKEFAEIYVFNLRGDIRAKEKSDSKRDGENIFDIMTGVAITILVKRAHNGHAKIFYLDIGDYLTREQKFSRIHKLGSVLNDEFEILKPNERGDWINQRGNDFETFRALAPDKKFDGTTKSFFVVNSLGIATGRDAFAYNFSRSELEKNIRTTIDYYNTHDSTDIDPTKFVWNDNAVQNKNNEIEYNFDAAQIVESFYRPFCKSNLYYDKYLNQRRYQMPKFFPTGHEENLLICVTGASARKNFSVLITNRITDLHFNDDTQCFPLYWYETATQGSLFGESIERRDGISDWILNEARKRFGANVSKEDIFYYVYGFLHLPSYREKFSAELKKSLPRIILSDKFWELSRAGRQLADIHLNYESQPPAQVEVIGDGDFRVKKLKLVDDGRTLIYNDNITVKNIPLRAYEYVVNGRSPLEWIIDRYQVKEDKASGIINNPNDWASEHGNERYILNLILSSITVSLKTLDIIENLPAVEL